jgi:predicted DNA-binding protein
MSPPARRNFHVPLPAETYDALREQADSRGIPATSLVREAVEGWLDDQRRMRLAEEIAAYASALAGSTADLDPDLEKAAVESLRTTSIASARA